MAVSVKIKNFGAVGDGIGEPGGFNQDGLHFSGFIRNIRFENIRAGCLKFAISMDAARYCRTPLFRPENLSFLPQIPLSKLDHKPLMYEKTKDGFRIFSHTDKGKMPYAEDVQYYYRVRLDGKK